MEILAEHALELKTYVVHLAFRDAEGVLVVPKSAKWTLTDSSGATVNGRRDMVIAALANEVDVVLEGLDLALPSTDPLRVFTTHYVYDSTEGNDKRAGGEIGFLIDPMLNDEGEET